MKIIYWYEIIVVLLNYSFFYLNNIFQMWLHFFNYCLFLYKVIKLTIICIIYLYHYFPFSNNYPGRTRKAFIFFLYIYTYIIIIIYIYIYIYILYIYN